MTKRRPAGEARRTNLGKFRQQAAKAPTPHPPCPDTPQLLSPAPTTTTISDTHPRCVNPILRYQIGDRGEFARCRCGRPEPALRVLGRMDQQVKFRTILFTPWEVAQTALTDAQVDDVQFVIHETGTPHERMQVRLRLKDGCDEQEVSHRVRKHLLGEHYRIHGELASDIDFAVTGSETFALDPRTK